MAEKVLGVEPNASLNEVKKAYYSKVKALDESDEKFQELFDSYTNAYNELVHNSTTDKMIAGYGHNNAITPFDTFFSDDFLSRHFFSLRPFDAFSQLHNRVSSLMDRFSNESFLDVDIGDTNDNADDVDDVEETTVNEPNSYCKYVSSVTSYNNGKRYSKTTSRVEKVKDGKKRVSHITKTQDGDKVTIERTKPKYIKQ